MIAKAVTIHCSDSGEVSSETISKWHIERGFRTIGYHAVVHRHGVVDSRANKPFFRGLNELGAHVKGYNKIHGGVNIGVCYVGRKTFTRGQLYAGRSFIESIIRTYQIPVSEIYCHNEWSSKTCPNMRVANLVAFQITGRIEFVKQYLKE